jgi:DNA-binding MarR family transcriptional regulator
VGNSRCPWARSGTAANWTDEKRQERWGSAFLAPRDGPIACGFNGHSHGPFAWRRFRAAGEQCQYRRGSCRVNHLAKPLKGRTVVRGAGDVRLAAWWQLMAAHARLVQRVGGDLAAVSALPLGSYNVLRLLQEAPGCRLRLGELASAVHLTRSGVTRLVNRLERAGLLRREGHAQDRRGSCAILTDRGREELRHARAVFERVVAEQFGSRLSDAEAETLNAVLGRIVTAETGADSYANPVVDP